MKLSLLPIALSTSLALVFVACTPQGEGTSSPPEASSSSADAGLDAARESGSTSDGASACPPETRGYEPLVDAPPRPAARVCTDAEVSALVRDCLESPDRWFDPACTAHTDACAACMLSKGSDKAWGAIVELEEGGGTGFVPNQSGCIDLSTGIPGCGTRITGFSDCSDYACSTERCSTETDRNACVLQASRDGACAPLAPDAACRAAYTSRGTPCTSPGKAGFLAAMKAFCQSP